MNLSLLVHTFNAYQHLWPGCLSSWNGINTSGFPRYFGTDTSDHKIRSFGGFRPLYSDIGEWSDRLRSLVTQIDTPYIMYSQEDHWPTGSPPDLEEMMKIATQKGILRLQLSQINRFYKLEGEGIPQYFTPESKYLVSHQPSIWKKSFLIDCLRPGETPWVNEYRGTLRWQETSHKRNFIRGKIAIYPCDWFSHRCIKGRVVES